MISKRSLALLAGATMAVSSVLPLVAAPFNSNTFGGLRARAIGPAVMSGRIAALDGVAADPMTLYVGAASGGVWKTVDGGNTFQPVFDDHTQSIGAIRIDPTDPETVWVGTGEPWVRNSVSYGDGVYKTTDGGDSWTHVGLPDSERIGAIRIHPENGDVVYVCVTGHLFNANEERGVYKTTDGGETWERILYVDADTGCADLDIDPQDGDILYAAMWQFRRSAHFFTSGGPGSGLHRSMDGGKTWERLEEGLPEGDLGRIAVAVAPSRPNVLYATVEAKENALYRSDDLGKTWRWMNASTNIKMRPFYFSELVVDPTDHQRVYKPGFVLTVSVDGGKSFSSMFGGGFNMPVHPDHHALWINPTNAKEMFLGTDGGLYVSYDGSNSWRHSKSLPISQFYQVGYDMEFPYNVYGGLQDNGTWTGPSQGPGGVTNADWKNIGFGDGFWAFPDPTDVDTVYVEFQGGRFMRVDRKTGAVQFIPPYAEGDQEELRFNWNSPIHMSPNHPGTVYYGSQHLHRSKDRGLSWETISPDLTTDDPAKQRQSESGGLTIDNSTAENHCTIYSISESPVDDQVIWVGTDDGNLQVTRDGGATWTLVSTNIEGMPAAHWVSTVHASPHDAASAFATFDGHWSGDKTTYIYVTRDHGATWTSLGADNLEGYAHNVVQDPENADLLYLGTEMGLWISLDAGAHWARFTENLPKVAIHAIQVHPREHDLILGTHGRGVYIIDDVTPLRHLTTDVLDANVALLPSRPAPMVVANQLNFGFAADGFVGENPPGAAAIVYYLKKRHLFGDLKVEVYGDDGELITTLPGGKRKGLNRVDWPMRFKPPKMPAATNLVPAFLGPRVPEGTYRVKLIKGKETLEGEVHLVADPREPFPEADRKLQQTTSLALYDSLAELTYLVDNLVHLRDAAQGRSEGLSRQADKRKLDDFADRLDGLRRSLVSTSDSGMLSGDEKLRERLGNLYGDITGYDGRPTDAQVARKDQLMGALESARGKSSSITADLDGLNRLLEKRGAEPIEALDRSAWNQEQGLGGTGALLVSKRDRLRLQHHLQWVMGAF
ncbi:MAG: glycosyl hydrolase [Acidobacteriota bacterium]